MLTKRLAVGTAAATLALAGLAGCSSSSDPAPTQTAAPTASPSLSPSASASEGESTVAFDKQIQEELNAVGCHSGAVDGIMGPETDAALVRFQEAEGLEVDGELGPETEAALKKAVSEGKQACTTPTACPTASPTTTPSPTSTTAPCTGQAISAALKSGEQLQSFICVNVAAERWAAGQAMNGPAVENFFLKAEGSQWVRVPNDEVCGGASAGLPPKLLDYCGLT